MHPNPQQCSCQYCLDLGDECIFIPPIPTHHSSSALLSLNCVECIRSHRRCKFMAPTSTTCIRCSKFDLNCHFKFSERGRRTDISPRTNNIDPTRAQAMTREEESTTRINIDPSRAPQQSQVDGFSWCGIVSDPGAFVPMSGRSHYPPSILAISCGSSCHARVEFSHHDQKGTRPPVYVSPGVPPWVHVFSKSTQSSSLRTQLASVAHSEASISHKSHNNRKNHAKKKFKKQQ